MKLTIYFLICGCIITSCTSNNNNTTPQISPEVVVVEPTNISTSFELPPVFNKYDCSTCHQQQEKLQGPSYEEIAAKYQHQKTAVSYLADKIIKGGSGVWGEVPMNAHSTMPAADATELATYILSLNSKPTAH